MAYNEQICSPHLKQLIFPNSKNREKNSETDRAEKNQRKQLILIDSKYILTCRLQHRQYIQSNFMTDTTELYIYHAQWKQLKIRNVIVLIAKATHTT